MAIVTGDLEDRDLEPSGESLSWRNHVESGRRIVLLVDRSRPWATPVSETLADHGWRPTAVRDSQRCLKFEPAASVIGEVEPIESFLKTRQRTASHHGAPVIAISRDPSEAVEVLAMGADDCVPVDVSPAELLLRLSRLLNLPPPPSTPPLTIGELTIDVDLFEVRISGVRVDLTPVQIRLLLLLAARCGESVSTRELFAAGWDAHQEIAMNLLRPQVTRLRSALRNSVRLVVERGHGYRLEPIAS